MLEFILTLLNSISWVAVGFHTLAAVVCISALLVIFVRNIVHAALWLAVCFISLAGVFMTLDAPFIAAVQLLVYAGAVCIMVVFAIMLIRRGNMGETNQFNKQVFAGGGVAVLVTVLSGFLSFNVRYGGQAPMVPGDSVDSIATLLLSKYVIPFEVAALLLLVALVGAIFLAKEVKAGADSER